MKSLLVFRLCVMAIIMLLTSSLQMMAQRRLLVEDASLRNADAQKQSVVNVLSGRAKDRNVRFFKTVPDVLKDNTLAVSISARQESVFVLDEMDFRDYNDFTWHGHLLGDTGGTAVITFINGEIAGNIIIGSRKYTLSPFGAGACSLYEVDDSRFPKDHPEAYRDIYEKSLKNDGGAGTNDINDPYTCKVRVLVAFTPSAESGASSLGYTDMKLFVQQSVSETNQSFINSNVTHRIDLAAAVRVSYTESSAFETDLSRFQGTSDGYMDEIHTYRSLFAADMNVLIINNGAYCGLASTIVATSSNAFCAVHYDCAVGYYSFGHELGHLYGARHNPETDPTNSPYAYGHGYCYAPGNWRTIMSYAACGSNPTRLPYWSNPSVTYGGVAMGTTSTHNNARVLNERAATVANFVSIPSSVTLTGNGALLDEEVGNITATTSITLSPGFSVTSNAAFTAYIATCTGGFSIASQARSSLPEAVMISEHAFGELTAIYPNPAEGYLRIAVPEATDNIDIHMYDMFRKQGPPVAYRNIGQGVYEINLQGYAPGLYIVEVATPKGKVVKKIVLK